MKRGILSLMAGLGLMTASNMASAQELTLGQPVATYDEALSFLQTVREMPDGRILIADPLGGELFFLNLETGARQDIGREGQGPMEYRQPDAVWPLTGDRSLLVDLGNARLTELDGDGTFGETHQIMIGEMRPGSSMIMLIPQGVDDQGRVYVTQRAGYRPGQDFPDSMTVVRADLATSAIDTLGKVKTQDMDVQASGGNVSIQQIPLSPADAWGVARDGRVVIARSGDYHVEWHHADGTVVSGSPVDVRSVRIGTAEKREYVTESANTGVRIDMMMGPGGQANASLSRGASPGDDEPRIDGYDWPDTKPPVVNGRINVDGMGRAWVQRSLPAGEARIYDLFGADGNRISSVTMPEGRRVISFGEGAVYVTYLDEFDLVYLEKYELP